MLTIAKALYNYRELTATLVWYGIAMEKWCLTIFPPHPAPMVTP